jgi:hypothetical protein
MGPRKTGRCAVAFKAVPSPCWDGTDARDAVKALVVANEYLESEVCELMQAVSHAYARGRFKTYTG